MKTGRMKTQENVRKMVLTALFLAIIIVLTFVPNTGYLRVGVIEMTIIHIPIIIGAITLGPAGGTLLGAVWGVTCLINAFFITAPLFTNPLVSVLPRIIVGFVAGWLPKLLEKSIKPKTVVSVITAILATLTNTVLVLTAISLFGNVNMLMFSLDENSLIITLFKTIAATNGVIELVLASVLTPAIVYPLRLFLKNTER